MVSLGGVGDGFLFGGWRLGEGVGVGDTNTVQQLMLFTGAFVGSGRGRRLFCVFLSYS